MVEELMWVNLLVLFSNLIASLWMHKLSYTVNGLILGYIHICELDVASSLNYHIVMLVGFKDLFFLF